MNKPAKLQTIVHIHRKHLSQEDQWYLNEHEETHLGEYGWFMGTGVESDDEILPENLVNVLRYASELGAEFALFDSDGQTCDGLPIHHINIAGSGHNVVDYGGAR